jgi:hypothetical protein
VSSTTTQPMLEGMPESESLRLLTHEGEVVVLAGRWVLFRFAVADIGMRRHPLPRQPLPSHTTANTLNSRKSRITPIVSHAAATARPPQDFRILTIQNLRDPIGSEPVIVHLDGGEPLLVSRPATLLGHASSITQYRSKVQKPTNSLVLRHSYYPGAEEWAILDYDDFGG